jgi:LPPG:FO 2-phospho-L-lactate transferase
MNTGSVVALSGGIGGAKLCLGLQSVLRAGALSVIVNTADDFEHLGLRISPDVDTTLYTLAGLANAELGWGRRDETWTFMRALETLGGETWFRLGDADLALHVERSRRLLARESLSAFTADVARRLGISTHILPMTDDVVRTVVTTATGELGFQDYFVRARCVPAVERLHFSGIENARIAAGVDTALRDSELRAIVIAPSNPYLSIDPILALPGMRAALRAAGVPVIAVTPIIGELAVKGPTAKIMSELGLRPAALTVAEHYDGLIDGFMLDVRDAQSAASFELPTRICDSLMVTLDDRERVARRVLEFAAALAA